MRNNRNYAFLAGVVLTVLLLSTCTGKACPSCYGDPGSSLTEGMNMAIVSLLGVTGGVLGAFAAFFLYLRHRIRSLNQRFADKLN